MRYLGCLLALSACGSPDLLPGPPEPSEAARTPDSGVAEPDSGLPTTDLRVFRVTPNHGPFVGGNMALIRGEGFDAADEIVVRFGGTMVNPLFLARVDAARIEVVVPAGVPGPVDVEVSVGDDTASLPDGYTYDQLYIEPTRGSAGGGTLVRITGNGAGFSEGDEVHFDRWPCTDVVVVSENVIECFAPPGVVGPVDVTVRQTDGTETTIVDGFEYYDTTGDGLSGGPSDGTINITVVDVDTSMAVAEASVFIGDDVDSANFLGLTDAFGRVTFSGEELAPPLKVHVVRDCYESASFVVFDAQDVTAYVTNLCPNPGSPPDGIPPLMPPRQFVNGELIWLGPNEYGPNPWSNIPEPRDGDWRRVAYVYTTRPCPFDTRWCLNPDPGLFNGRPRVLEQNTGELGYPYRIFSRDGALAVYALAGLENPSTTEFVPYVMGIARNVLVGPGEDIQGVDIIMDIPLDHYLDVRLDDVPDQPAGERGELTVRADIDLGGEGVIMRYYAGRPLDRLVQRVPERPFRFGGQPALHGALSDGRYRVDAFWAVNEDDAEIVLGGRATPRWHAVKTGIRAVDEEVVIDDFIGVPRAVAPTTGARISAERTIEWTASGTVEPTFWQIQLNEASPTGITPMWSLFVRGDQTSAALPDVERLPDIADPANRANLLQILAVYIPGLDFNDVSYADLAEQRWAAWSVRYLFIEPL